MQVITHFCEFESTTVSVFLKGIFKRSYHLTPVLTQPLNLPPNCHQLINKHLLRWSVIYGLTKQGELPCKKA